MLLFTSYWFLSKSPLNNEEFHLNCFSQAQIMKMSNKRRNNNKFSWEGLAPGVSNHNKAKRLTPPHKQIAVHCLLEPLLCLLVGTLWPVFNRKQQSTLKTNPFKESISPDRDDREFGMITLRHVNQLWLCCRSSRKKWATCITGKCKQKIEVKKKKSKENLTIKTTKQKHWAFERLCNGLDIVEETISNLESMSMEISRRITWKEKSTNYTDCVRTVGEVVILSGALQKQSQAYWCFCFAWLDLSVFDSFCLICLAFCFSRICVILFQTYLLLCCWSSCRW